jgi:ligand-binding sensor domain-containing protein
MRIALVVALALIAAMPLLRCPREESTALPRPTPTPLQPAPAPAANAVFSSTRQVNNITIAPDGTIWVATSGGVLRRAKDGGWQKFTRLSGLPAHEIQGFLISQEGEVRAQSPRGSALWRAGAFKQWVAETDASKQVAAPRQTTEPQVQRIAEVTWRGAPVIATLTGLVVPDGESTRTVPLPKSKGTHISALLPRGNALWAALFGDGLWSFDGRDWKPVNIGLPAQAREITALSGKEPVLWVGTRRDGLWEYNGKTWKQHLQPDEPFDHNAQSLTSYRGVLLMTTLEDGLAARTRDGWRQYGDNVLSSNAPRQMVEFDKVLYVRHGGGRIDRFDGARWTRNVFPWLPRRKAFAIGSDGKRLCVAQWGGWSEWDGKTWQHYLNVPELQGLPLMGLYPDGSTLWIATQSRGVGEFDYTTGKLRWHDERHGLPDDWITTITRVGSTLYAGTFVGGLAWWDGKKWTTAPQLKGENVTALEPDGADGLYIATRNGVWHRTQQGTFQRLNDKVDFLDTEVQALCKVPEGLWIGARTGLFFVTKASLEAAL